MRSLAVLLIAATVPLTTAAFADEDTNYDGVLDAAGQQLAVRFAPAFVLHLVPSESVQLEPEPVEILSSGSSLSLQDLWVTSFFADGSNLETYQWADPRNVLNGSVTSLAAVPEQYVSSIGKYYKPHFEFGGPGNESYQAWRTTYEARGPLFTPTVYARLFNNGDGSGVIEYWMYYPFNQWVNNHEGDWEHVRLTISSLVPGTAEIVSAQFFFHKSYVNVGSSLLPLLPLLDGTHPVIYVGGRGDACPCNHCQLGDHSGGSYPAPGTWDNAAILDPCDPADDTLLPGRFIAPHELDVQVMPNASVIGASNMYWSTHPDVAWTKTEAHWGHLISPSAGTLACTIPVFGPEPCFNASPVGPYYNTPATDSYPAATSPLVPPFTNLFIVLEAGDVLLRPNIQATDETGLFRTKRAPAWVFNSSPAALTTVTLPRFVEEGGVTYEFVAWDDGEGNTCRTLAALSTRIVRARYTRALVEVLPRPITTMGSRALAWGDFDNDGLVDLVVATSTTSCRLHLWRNTGGGSFQEAGSTGLCVAGNEVNGLACADFDNDGLLDLFVTTSAAKRLFRNLGGTQFSDVAAGRPIENATFGSGAAWADVDRDGLVDIYLANAIDENYFVRNGGANPAYASLPPTWSSPDQWVWSRFRQNQLGVPDDIGVSRSVAWAHYDADPRIDLMLSNFGQLSCFDPPNRLMRNGTEQAAGSQPTFAMVNGACGNGIPLALGGARAHALAWGDYDNEAFNDFATPDLLAANQNGVQLFRNVRVLEPPMPQDGEPMGDSLAFVPQFGIGLPTTGEFKGAAWVDFENDGDLDLCLARTDSLFLYENYNPVPDAPCLPPTATHHFRKVPIAALGSSPGAFAWADFDGDGDLDLAMGGASGYCDLYRNGTRTSATALTTSNYLHLTLVGTRSNRMAIGARVVITPSDPEQWEKSGEVEGGSGYASFNSLPLELGLGSATGVSRMVIRWPSGKVETVTSPISANQHLTRYEPVSVTASAEMVPHVGAVTTRGTVCPGGDGSAMVTTLHFNEPPFRTIAARELQLGTPTGPNLFFFAEDLSCSTSPFLPADGPADQTNAFTTTFTKRRISGCGATTVPVYWNGVQIASVTLEARGPDIALLGASVDASDVAAFVYSFGRPQHYNPCADFNYDGSVDAADVAGLANHLAHACHTIPQWSKAARMPPQEIAKSMAVSVMLRQSTPNPFNPTTVIRYSLPVAGMAQIIITDVRGRLVRRVVNGIHAAGDHAATWDAKDDGAQEVASGVYYCRLRAAGQTETMRMVLVR